jgi:membrane peptidoglycan carboxypeptidase
MGIDGLTRPWQRRYQADEGNAGQGGRRRRWVWRAVRVLAAVLVALVVAGGIIMTVTPSVGTAWSIASAQAKSHHSVFPGPSVPPKFSAALIATEDHRFGSEPGVDPYAIARVLLAGITGGGDQGGATLYQQLAKVLYTPGRGGIPTEIEQIALAVKLKYSYSDTQILRMYSAVVYFGHGFYGLEAASCGYYGRRPGKLSWPQAAVLAGLVQAPSAYDPLEFPRLARAREQHVISRLVATGVLTVRRAGAALAAPITRLTRDAGGCHA